MARNSLGSLIVSLGLDAAQYVAGLTKAEYQARKFSQNVKHGLNDVNNLLATIGVGALVYKFASLTKAAIDSADRLNDMSKATNIAADTLGGLGFAAQQSGADIDGVGKAVNRMNVEIGKALAGNKASVATFKSMGLSLKELGENAPEQNLALIADKFASYEDGTKKAALGNLVFSKSYREIAGLLDEGGQKLLENVAYFKRYSGLTQEAVIKSDEFNDTLVRINLQLGAFFRHLAIQLLPSLQAVSREFLNAQENGDQFKGVASDVADGLREIGVAAVASVVELTNFIDAMRSLVSAATRFKPLAFVGAIPLFEPGAIDAADRDMNEFFARQEKRFADRDRLIAAIRSKQEIVGPPSSLANRPKRGKAPGVPDQAEAAAAAREAEAQAKRLVDGQIRALERGIAQERDIFNARNDFLRDAYQDGYLSAQNFFALLGQAREEELGEIIAFYDKQIATQKAYRSTLAKESDRIEVTTRIEDIEEKRANAIRDTAAAASASNRDMVRELAQYGAQVDEINAKLLELAGNTAAAARIRFNAQTDLLRRQFRSAGNADGLAALDALRKQTVAVAALNDEQRKYQGTLEDLGFARTSIDLQQQTGSVTEIQAIQKRSTLARAYIDLLNEQIDAQVQIIETMAAGPEQEAARRAIQRMRLEVDALAASANELANKFNDAFAGPVSNAIEDLATGAKSLKEVFRDLEKSIVGNLSRIAAQNIAESLFGGVGTKSAGPISWIGEIVGSLFGGGLAGGTNFWRGGPTMVGERGPEVVNLPRGAQVIPNDVLRQKRAERAVSVTNYITVPAGTSRSTAEQMAVAVGRGVGRAMRRTS
jgi:hypothetical protein